MDDWISYETQSLLDAADRVIAQSRELIQQRREIIAAYKAALRQHEESGFVLLCERLKSIKRARESLERSEVFLRLPQPSIFLGKRCTFEMSVSGAVALPPSPGGTLP